MMTAMDPLFDLTGLTALVTGGSRGLGREIVRAFASHGADVVVVSRKIEACEETCEEVRAMGGRALAYSAHVGRWDQIDALIEHVYAEFGKIDILVNNAGMSPRAPSHEVTEKLFDSVLNLNFKGAFRLAAQIGKRMADGDGGSIINVSSTAALFPSPEIVPYAAAKAALNAMSSCLALEYGPKVRVNTLSAGPFLTDIAKAWPEELRHTAPGAQGRVAQPDEIASTALFLASPRSSFVTGALVRCDGGVTTGSPAAT